MESFRTSESHLALYVTVCVCDALAGSYVSVLQTKFLHLGPAIRIASTEVVDPGHGRQVAKRHASTEADRAESQMLAHQ